MQGPDKGFHQNVDGRSKGKPVLCSELPVERSREDEDAQKFSYHFCYSDYFHLAKGTCTQTFVLQSSRLCNK